MATYWPQEWLINGGVTQATTTNNLVWPTWVTHTTTTTAVYNEPYWPQWVIGPPTGSYSAALKRRAQVPLPPQLDAKAQATLARRQRIGMTRRHVASLRARVAKRKAEQLLIENLDNAQRMQWARDREFHVETADGKRTYRIREGLAGNVYLVRDTDRPQMMRTRRYCMHVTEAVPVCDNVLDQKLLIEANEEQFLALANVA